MLQKSDGKIQATQEVFEDAQMEANQQHIGELHGQVEETDELLSAQREIGLCPPI